jgi:hypothetical protein
LCKTIVYIYITAEHESTDLAATNKETIMINIYQAGKYVATINKIDKAADTYKAHESAPWLLLKSDGKCRGFASLAEAKDEALKVFAGCKFKRT